MRRPTDHPTLYTVSAGEVLPAQARGTTTVFHDYLQVPPRTYTSVI
ncbi:MAG: hypothetical protein NTY51_05655 [Deltaproteobacteria bacterium]|nr:hypothetical protein [Deltaproteobacteria bacterium]